MTDIKVVFDRLDEHKQQLLGHNDRLRDLESGHISLKKDHESMYREMKHICVQLETTKAEVVTKLSALQQLTSNILSRLDQQNGADEAKKSMRDLVFKFISALPTLACVAGAIIFVYTKG